MAGLAPGLAPDVYDDTIYVVVMINNTFMTDAKDYVDNDD